MRLPYLVILVSLVACGGQDLTATQACTDVSQDRCMQLATCSAADLSKRWTDLASCEDREKLACLEAQAAPKTAATPATVEACANALTTQACDAFLSGVASPAECLPHMGPIANGAACSTAAQCASGFCAVATTALCGTCADQPVAGASCATSRCGPTMVCVKSTMQCQVPVAANGTCSAAQPCGQGLACVGAMPSVSGTCTAQVASIGAACDSRRVTAPDCNGAAGLACDATTDQCVTQPVVPAGMPCGVINRVDVACAAGATCTGTGTAKTCVAPAADGAACDTAAGPDCEFPARCVPTGTGTAGVCSLPGSTSC